MKQYAYLCLLSVFALASCSEAFKKGEKGIEYKIIHNGKGQELKPLNFMQLQITETYKGSKDTLLSDSRDYMPRIIGYDSVSTPIAYYKILGQMRKGDSAVVRILTDSLFKDAPERMPKFMAKGKYLYTSIKMLNIFTTVKEADSAQDAEAIIAKPKILKMKVANVEKDLAKNEAQLKADIKKIADYLAKNNIKATQAKWGTFITVTTEGTGSPITMEDVVDVNYTGRVLDSAKAFDSNTDPAFKHPEPYKVAMAQLGTGAGVISGWYDALLQLKKGSKARVYIPSTLGYGTVGSGAMIKANDILVFDLEVLNVENEAIAMKKMQEEQMAMQQKMMDAAKKDSAQKNMPKN